MSLRRVPFGFTPLSITGCQLWLDGADSSSITSVTGVSQWNDKSGNGYNLTQGNTGSQPTRTGNLLNFVSNYNMNIPQAAVNNASTWSMFFLVNPIASVNWFMAKQRDGVNSYNIFSTTQTGGPGPNAYFTGSTNFLYVRMFNAGTLAASAAALTMSQLQLLAFIYDGTSMFIYINGNLSSTTVGSFVIQNDTSATNFLSGQWFGNGTNYNSSGNFQLGELVYFNTFLAATQRQQIESYLAQKWGLNATLPGGHPGLTTTVFRPDYLKNSAIIRNTVRPIAYFTTFSPRQIPGLGLWLDAADSSTVTGTTPITGWTDKSGNGRTVTITSGPTYGTTSQGGNRTMVFNNNTITTSIASAVGTGDFTLIAVWYQSSAGTNTVLSLGTVASSSQSLGFSGNKYNFYQFGDVNESAYSASTPSWVVQIGTRIGSVKKVYINGNGGTTPSSTSYDVSVTTVTIGKGDNFAISGEIGEIMIYTGTMSDTSRQSLESYLSQKWGLTGALPGGHSHFTQRAGAITRVANTKFSMVGVPRIIFTATGGTIVTSGFKYHLFTSSSNFVVSMDSKTVNYLVVGGGGGGGDRHGGGGGGGGVLTGTWTASVGTYTVTVGLGGVAGYYETNNSTPRGAGIKGGDSSLSGTGVSVTANGGGGGGTYDGNPTGTVGSGGGGGGNNLGGVAGTAGQGNAGGSGSNPGGGGGGGAGGVGANANTSTGGIGTTSYSTQLLAVGYGTSFAVPTSPNVVISGGVAYIAAGGGGAASGGPGPGGSGGLGGGGRGDWNASFIQAGTANTGGGGGGSRSESEPSFGRDGGSGLVLLWYSV
jgi:hypothetical protein